MTELIKITEKDGKKAVSARELYGFLSVDDGRNFTKWGKANIEDMFIKDIDYQTLRVGGEKGRPSVDYALTLDCAKEISMMSRCDNGKQARQYFIECEKQLIKISDTQSILGQAQLILQSIQAIQNVQQTTNKHEEQLSSIENKIAIIEKHQEIEIKQDYFTILAYCKIHGIQITFSEAIKKGKIASRLSKEKGYDMIKTSDMRYGYVNSYKESILKETFSL
jgi:anti-repressor protein